MGPLAQISVVPPGHHFPAPPPGERNRSIARSSTAPLVSPGRWPAGASRRFCRNLVPPKRISCRNEWWAT